MYGKPVYCDVDDWVPGQSAHLLPFATVAQLPKRSAEACLRELGHPKASSLTTAGAASVIRQRHILDAVIVTDGNNGFGFSRRGLTGSREAFAVEAVDTTGAGDVFGALVLLGLVQKHSVERACDLACAVAAVSVQYDGHTHLLSHPNVLLSGVSRLVQA